MWQQGAETEGLCRPLGRMWTRGRIGTGAATNRRGKTLTLSRENAKSTPIRIISALFGRVSLTVGLRQGRHKEEKSSRDLFRVKEAERTRHQPQNPCSELAGLRTLSHRSAGRRARRVSCNSHFHTGGRQPMNTCNARTASSQSQLRMSPAAWSNCILIGCGVARQKWGPGD